MFPCGKREAGTLGWILRVGCARCKGYFSNEDPALITVDMAFYCKPGAHDKDYRRYYPGNQRVDILVTNID